MPQTGGAVSAPAATAAALLIVGTGLVLLSTRPRRIPCVKPGCLTRLDALNAGGVWLDVPWEAPLVSVSLFFLAPNGRCKITLVPTLNGILAPLRPHHDPRRDRTAIN